MVYGQVIEKVFNSWKEKKCQVNTVVSASDLNKSFSGIAAAHNINASLIQGEIVGIIGANGAGKTVFVNMMTGYLKPTSGKCIE